MTRQWTSVCVTCDVHEEGQRGLSHRSWTTCVRGLQLHLSLTISHTMPLPLTLHITIFGQLCSPLNAVVVERVVDKVKCDKFASKTPNENGFS